MLMFRRYKKIVYLIVALNMLILSCVWADRASAANELAGDTLSYSLTLLPSPDDRVKVRLEDEAGQKIQFAVLESLQQNNNGTVISEGQSYTDSEGEASVYIKDNTVAEIKLTYQEETCLLVRLKRAGAPLVSMAVATGLGSLIAVTTFLTVGGLLLSGLGMVSSQIGLKELILLLSNYLFVLFGLKRRNKLGMVYDVSTQKPVPRAIVQLYEYEQIKLTAVAMTDKDGTYLFSARPGKYVLSVVKPGFIFPSQIIQTVGDVSSAYIGQTFEVNNNNPIVNMLIPIDPDPASQIKVNIFFRLAAKTWLRYSLILLGTIASVYSFMVMPGIMSDIYISAFLILWLAELSVLSRNIKYSLVVASQGRSPIGLALVRVVDQFGKLVETFISDNNGRVLPRITAKNQKIIVEKSGYHTTEFVPRGEGLIEKRVFEVLQK